MQTLEDKYSESMSNNLIYFKEIKFNRLERKIVDGGRRWEIRVNGNLIFTYLAFDENFDADFDKIKRTFESI